MTETSGKQYVLWLRLGKHRQSLVHKTYCFPRSQSISVNSTNYRPISILPTISNILEKAIYMQLSTYLEGNKLLSTSQFGFRLNSNTMLATAKFTDKVLQSMDAVELTGAVFIDLAKAFDTVNHKILLRKLHLLGGDDHACEWFESFLSDRSQVTVYDNVQSKTAKISMGVAQWSIIGPLLFVIYVNDLPNVLESCQVTLFAVHIKVLKNYNKK